MDSIKVENANKRNKCQQDGIKNNFFSGLVIFNKVKSIRPSDGNISQGLFFRPTDE